jgi:hypothetical protein
MRCSKRVSLVALVVFVATLFTGSSAFGLDGYQDRENVFGGISAGGGYGFLNEDGERTDEGPGLAAQAIIGGGVTESLLLGVEADWWSRSVNQSGNNKYGFYHTAIGGTANWFVLEGLHLDGGAGFAYGVCSGTFEGRDCTWQELGMQAEAGLGYEFWFNGTLAGGVDLSYNHHFYSHSAFDTVTMTFGLRWY